MAINGMLAVRLQMERLGMAGTGGEGSELER